MDNNQSTSPVPQLKPKAVQMGFAAAIQKIIDGRKVTRVEWDNTNTYGLMKDGLLIICIDGEFRKWIVTDGDMLAQDWVVITEAN